MRQLITRSFLIYLVVGIAVIIGLHQASHSLLAVEYNEYLELVEAAIAILVLAALLMAHRIAQNNERSLRAVNAELLELSAERTQALAELRESRASLANAQRIAHLGSWDWNIQTGALTWSDEIYRIFGLTPQEFGATYEAFLDSIHPDDRDSVIEAVNHAVYDKHPYVIDHRVMWPDGTIRFVHEQGEVRFNEAGEPIFMSGTVHDITERKQREDEIHALNADLERRVEERTAKLLEEITVRKAAEKQSRREREKAQQYLTMAGNMLVALDRDGRIDMINAKGAEILGYDISEELVGRDWFDIALPPEERHIVRNVFQQIISGNHAAYEEFENEILTKSGDTRLMQWHNAVLRDDNGKITGTLGAATDITEQKQHEDNLLRAKEAAEAANRTKSGFLSNMSHELRTPMNAILGFGQLVLSDRDKLTDSQEEYLDIILRSGNHLLTLINEILDLSRIETGTLKVELETLSPAQAINEASTLLSPIAAKHNVTLHSDDAIESLPNITADAARLQQVLVNLLSNAIKYNRDQGQVFVGSTMIDEDMLRIFVQDTGHGIPAPRRHELFQPFNRLDAENSGIEGTGVGLVLTKNLVELMGGRIGFDSVEGKGSTFWIDLPAIKGEHQFNINDVQSFAPLGREKTQHRILCVEHNPTDLRLLQDIVKRLDTVELIPAPDSERAMELAKIHEPDLVLLTVEMPCSGVSPLHDWCQKRPEPIPVMAVCECQGLRDRDECKMQDFTACVDKPLHLDKTLNVLCEVLGLSGVQSPNVVQLSSVKKPS